MRCPGYDGTKYQMPAKKYHTDEERRAAKQTQRLSRRIEENTTARLVYAARTPEKRDADNVCQKAWRAARTPEKCDADAAAQRAAITPELRVRNNEAKKAKRAAQTPAQRHNNHLLRYGITDEEYVVMWEIQGRRCKICGTELSLRHRRTTVDHCHATGRVRGILCAKCNQAVGVVEGRGNAGLIAILDYLG